MDTKERRRLTEEELKSEEGKSDTEFEKEKDEEKNIEKEEENSISKEENIRGESESNENVIEEKKDQTKRHQSNRRQPEKLKDYVHLTFEEATQGKDKENWKKAIEEEKTSLKEHKVWTLVERKDAHQLIFKFKEDELYNAILVVRGSEQKFGEDFKETYGPVIGNNAIRMIFAIAAQKTTK
ncbi:golgin subfamily A member 6-like protein 22 [Onthophagus taurus]|uniref:golgin subfamily A member 6-like protein 22 n=1 Tax=Onthophagus taurus TaxID=166361 RepID=UPI0039BDBB17